MESPSNSRKRKLSTQMEQQNEQEECPMTSDEEDNYISPEQQESWEVIDVLNKRFEFTNENYNLPKPEHMFSDDNWIIPKLQDLKKNLNETKSRLNDFNLNEWQKHTRHRNRGGNVQMAIKKEINPEFLTQAWCKFWENVSSFPLIPPHCLEKKCLNSVHLCEAPGAFVASLNHYLQLHAPEVTWKWFATSLNPHYEGNSLDTMINDDRFILHTQEHWFFGQDCTGDIMQLENLQGIVSRSQEMEGIGLVTADGSISCIDAPDEQESIVARLHLCEAIAAMSILEEGGSLLIKIFTVFEAQTVCLLFLLICSFQRVVMNKPATSKEGNSEVYLVCLGFKGRERVEGQLEVLRGRYVGQVEAPMFRRCDVPEGFVEQVYRAGEFFMRKQCEVIEDNVDKFLEGGMDFQRGRVKELVVEEFVDRYGVWRLREVLEIVGKRRLRMIGCEVMESRFSEDSYNDRKRKEELGSLEKLRIVGEEVEMVVKKEAKRICSGPVSFRFSNDPGPLKITLGKPYESVKSSRFCFAKILKNFNLVLQIQKELDLNVQFPNVEIKEKLALTSIEKKKVHCFEYSPRVDIRIIHELMKNIEEGQSIIFVGYCLLTQWNIGILYVLAHAFEALELQLEDDIGCLLTLSNYKKGARIKEIIGEIFEASEKAKENNQIVISIFPMITLCACEMYQAILKMNHGTIKEFIRQIVKKVNS